ncbi:MAG: 3-hydroxyacyl-CoA dehydrogenase family protein [Deltaproteobacteria bacterium]|nr:3-hydroxyacyl-CoA dehydrogenase family protein [Deltaproteobacteria bacterium]
MTIEKVFIVGSGLMGGGIAQVCAQAGMSAILNDENKAATEKALNTIAWSVGKLIEKGKLKEDKATVLGRIQIASGFERASDADLVVEAVFENLDVKKQIFKNLDAVCKPDTILASNTSAIPITELGVITGHPERVVGIHFFNPVPMMRAVEVVKGICTSEAVMNSAVEFVRKIGKSPIRVESDIPGFILNRINLVSYVEAIRLLERGIGTVSDIDTGVRMAFGRPMGPFETGDMVGLDVSYGGLTAIYAESHDPGFLPPQLLKRKVKAGQLGRKTGKGWYQYDNDGNKVEG